MTEHFYYCYQDQCLFVLYLPGSCVMVKCGMIISEW